MVETHGEFKFNFIGFYKVCLHLFLIYLKDKTCWFIHTYSLLFLRSCLRDIPQVRDVKPGGRNNLFFQVLLRPFAITGKSRPSLSVRDSRYL